MNPYKTIEKSQRVLEQINKHLEKSTTITLKEKRP